MLSAASHQVIHEEVVHSNQLPLTEFVDQFDLCAGLSFPSHWHHELELQLIISGKATYNINGVNYRLEEGDAVYIAPEAVHTMQAEVPGTVGYNIVLLPQFLIDLLQSVRCDKYIFPLTERRPDALLIKPDRKEGHAILGALRRMYYMESSHQSYDLFLLEHILGIWRNLLALFPKAESSQGNEGLLLRERRMKTMLSYIWNHYTQSISVRDVAASANISKSECFRCFAELSKTTPVEYINQFRLFQAAQALASTSKSIVDICYMTGFNNTSYFSKKFKEQYGMTPRDYRSHSLG